MYVCMFINPFNSFLARIRDDNSIIRVYVWIKQCLYMKRMSFLKKKIHLPPSRSGSYPVRTCRGGAGSKSSRSAASIASSRCTNTYSTHTHSLQVHTYIHTYIHTNIYIIITMTTYIHTYLYTYYLVTLEKLMGVDSVLGSVM